MGNEIEIDETGWANWNLVKKFSVNKKNEKPSHKKLPMPFYQTGNFIPETPGWIFWSEKSWLPSEQRKTPGSPQYMGQDRATCWGHPGVNFTPWSLRHTSFHHDVTGPNVRSESIVGWLGRCGSHVESGGKVRKCSYMKKGWEHGRLRIEDPFALGCHFRLVSKISFFHLENERRWAH